MLCVMATPAERCQGVWVQVFAYGQTGSGKTYTMGSAFTPGGSTEGVIPQAMEGIFERVSLTKDVDFTVRVGFVEIHKEEIKDLLVTEAGSHPQVSIREVAGGGVCLAGAHEREVRQHLCILSLWHCLNLSKAAVSFINSLGSLQW